MKIKKGYSMSDTLNYDYDDGVIILKQKRLRRPRPFRRISSSSYHEYNFYEMNNNSIRTRNECLYFKLLENKIFRRKIAFLNFRQISNRKTPAPFAFLDSRNFLKLIRGLL